MILSYNHLTTIPQPKLGYYCICYYHSIPRSHSMFAIVPVIFLISMLKHTFSLAPRSPDSDLEYMISRPPLSVGLPDVSCHQVSVGAFWQDYHRSLLRASYQDAHRLSFPYWILLRCLKPVAIYVRVYSWALSSIPLVYMSAFMPVPVLILQLPRKFWNQECESYNFIFFQD